jgi:hypothetical protein
MFFSECTAIEDAETKAVKDIVVLFPINQAYDIESNIQPVCTEPIRATKTTTMKVLFEHWQSMTSLDAVEVMPEAARRDHFRLNAILRDVTGYIQCSTIQVIVDSGTDAVTAAIVRRIRAAKNIESNTRSSVSSMSRDIRQTWLSIQIVTTHDVIKVE